ncbi:MAG: hypothetical protein FWD67_12780 [Betaproteobacteria bacterium]|nr:hypothetical protein [Betaproteobacteria bacterium]
MNQQNTLATENEGSSLGYEEVFIPCGRKVSVKDGLAWISRAFDIFMKNPKNWILYILVCVCIIIAIQVLPFIGQIVSPLAMLLLNTGAIYACNQLRQKGSFSFSDFFIAFHGRARPLLPVVLHNFILSASLGLFAILLLKFTHETSSGTPWNPAGFLTLMPVYLLFFLAIFLMVACAAPALVMLVTMLILSFIMFIFIGGEADDAAEDFIVFLILLPASTIYVMSMWFVPALVMVHKVAPVKAMKMSFSACCKNILPGIVFSISITLLIIISAIPLGLGLLVMMPILSICYYTSYRSIFFDGNN